MKNIAIIGAGWYGSHIALFLDRQHENGEKLFNVTLFEKNPNIFDETSGNFGIRLHLGWHYPRSSETRRSCREGLAEFLVEYPALVNTHEHSIYGVGDIDADGYPSKVTPQEFESLTHEYEDCYPIDPRVFGYENLMTAIHTTEPSIVVGQKLRSAFKKYLQASTVNLKLATTVKAIKRTANGAFLVSTENSDVEQVFDRVVNATSYQYFLPEKPELPFAMKVVYQPCVALVYKDTKEKERGKPNPFIVMDGWLPCLMSYDDCSEEVENRKYIMTHAKWTILASCNTPEAAQKILYETKSNSLIEKKIEKNCNKSLSRFWPEFKERFQYVKWIATVLAKIVTDSEYRSAVTFSKDEMLYVIPGKINNIFDAGRETLTLLTRNSMQHRDDILCEEGCEYVKGGTLDRGQSEISTKPVDPSRNTCSLQTSFEILSKSKQLGFFKRNDIDLSKEKGKEKGKEVKSMQGTSRTQ